MPTGTSVCDKVTLRWHDDGVSKDVLLNNLVLVITEREALQEVQMCVCLFLLV